MAPTESSLGSDSELDTSPLISDANTANDIGANHTNGTVEADVEMHEENGEQSNSEIERPKPKKRPSSIAGLESDQQRARPRKDSLGTPSNDGG